MPAVTVKSRPKRIADREHPLADARLSSSPSGDGRQILRVDLDDGDIGPRIAADDLAP